MNECGYFPARIDRRFCLGLDIGQVSDPSAVAVVERLRLPVEPIDGTDWLDGACRQKLTAPVFNVVHLERLRLEISYPDQVEYIASLLAREPLLSGPTKFALDKTGVGRAVFDLFTARQLNPIGITITGGREDTHDDWGGFHVAKVNLVGRLQTLFHTGTLKIAAALEEGPILANELRNFAATVAENSGNLSYNARSGQHDDLLLATAISCWTLVGPSHGTYATSELATLIR